MALCQEAFRLLDLQFISTETYIPKQKLSHDLIYISVYSYSRSVYYDQAKHSTPFPHSVREGCEGVQSIHPAGGEYRIQTCSWLVVGSEHTEPHRTVRARNRYSSGIIVLTYTYKMASFPRGRILYCFDILVSC